MLLLVCVFFINNDVPVSAVPLTICHIWGQWLMTCIDAFDYTGIVYIHNWFLYTNGQMSVCKCWRG